MTTTLKADMDMKNIFDNSDLERAPLDKLVEYAGSTLVESKLLIRAGRSALYKRRWREARFDPDKVKDLEGLRKAPFTTESNLSSACRSKSIKSYACSSVQMWFRATGRGAGIWWMPFGKNDVMQAWGMSRRLSRVVRLENDDILLMLTQPAPAFSDSLPYFLAYGHKLEHGERLEIMPVSPSLLQFKPKWTAFFLQRKPTVLVSTPDDALALARIMKGNRDNGNNGPGCTTIPDLAGRANAVPNQVKEAGSGSPLQKLRIALLYGVTDGAGSHEVSQEFGAETFQMGNTQDCLLFNVECRMHEGVHIWLDTCIPEILPATGPDGRSISTGLESQAVFLHEAKSGTRGELVVTTFREALPLVRYRTGQQVEVISTGQCRCGLSHPRVRLLQVANSQVQGKTLQHNQAPKTGSLG